MAILRSKLSVVRFVALSAAVLLASCDDAPTTVAPCELLSLGPTLAFVVPSASALQPALVDAQQRLLPGLATPQPVLATSISTLSVELATADEQSLCRAYNAVAERFQVIAAAAPSTDGPDIEGIRLAIRLAHAYLAAN